ncbi:MAG: peptide chain release factor N(5)-glutamine methyltransferase [Candidatus Gracilibacteria bacterium]|nr:peptide chain release factor N(5)-glutamine methyltransferase [Candidatus Gracilibacteria bacterium]
MKKNEIYKIGKDLGINDNKIEKIILKITDLSKSQLFLCDDIDDKFIENIKNSFFRLNNGEPIEYIINNAEFFGLDFYVDNRVLIPRNDTEVMVEKAIEEIDGLTHPPSGTSLEKGRNYQDITLIDVGTGSSCIAISILKNINKIENAFLVDISKDALEISKINIKLHKLENQINQIKGDLLKPLLPSPYQGRNSYKIGKNLIITANLPYIKNGDFENMDNETINFEPDIALYGGENTGFELYEKLILQCIELKKQNYLENMILFIEIGFDQKEVCEKFLNTLGISYEIFNDNSGIERCVKISI